MILVTLSRGYAKAIENCGSYTVEHEEFLRNPSKFSCVLFTGGADVDPSRYNDTSPLNICGFIKQRDALEFQIAEVAIKNNIPMLGICRGIQLLNVVAGGRLMHDVNNHAGSTHEIRTIDGGEFFVNSLHHQMALPPADAIVTAWSSKKRSRRYIGKHDLPEDYEGEEIEAVLYPEIKAFGVQYHPEMMSKCSIGHKYFSRAAEIVVNEGFNSFMAKVTTKNWYTDEHTKENSSSGSFI